MYLCTPDQLFCLLHILHVCNILHWGQKYPLFCRLDTYCYNILVVYVILYVYHVSYCDPMLLVMSNYFLKDKSMKKSIIHIYLPVISSPHVFTNFFHKISLFSRRPPNDFFFCKIIRYMAFLYCFDHKQKQILIKRLNKLTNKIEKFVEYRICENMLWAWYWYPGLGCLFELVRL